MLLFMQFNLIRFCIFCFSQWDLASKPATTTKPPDVQPAATSEKTSVEQSKSIGDDNQDEEIADDLSEISDEADDILAQQEVNNLMNDFIKTSNCMIVFFLYLGCKFKVTINRTSHRKIGTRNKREFGTTSEKCERYRNS